MFVNEQEEHRAHAYLCIADSARYSFLLGRYWLPRSSLATCSIFNILCIFSKLIDMSLTCILLFHIYLVPLVSLVSLYFYRGHTHIYIAVSISNPRIWTKNSPGSYPLQKDKDRNALGASWRQIKRLPAVHAAGIDRGDGKAAEMHLLIRHRTVVAELHLVHPPGH